MPDFINKLLNLSRWQRTFLVALLRYFVETTFQTQSCELKPDIQTFVLNMYEKMSSKCNHDRQALVQ